MKKNNTYLADDVIDLRDIIQKLWKEKILILSISIICGLLGYFYALSKPQILRSEIILKNPPTQIFDPYNLFIINYNNNNNNNISGQFISDFKLNLLSLDSIENFLEESREFDNFKGYLNSKNISAKQYFSDQNFGEVNEKNIIIPNKYFLNYPKELDGDIFLNKYVEFIRIKTIIELKNVFKLTYANHINNFQESLEIANKIQLENPITKTTSQPQAAAVNEPGALFYKGTKVLTENIKYLKQRMIKLENDQFNYNFILSKATTLKNISINPTSFFLMWLIFGFFLSLIIIYLRNILK